jgi:phage protein U
MPFREAITGIIDKAIAGFSGNDTGNAPVMLMLGGFKFSLNTAVFTELSRTTGYSWPGQERFGQYDALQYTGPGADRIRLPGIIYPDWRGGAVQVGQLRSLAEQGRPLRLIGPSGAILGNWIIESVEEGQSYYKPDGSFRRQEFTVSIRNFGDAADV